MNTSDLPLLDLFTRLREADLPLGVDEYALALRALQAGFGLSVNTSDLPLLDLFTRLREAGLPLGVDEYTLALRALQAGFGLSDRDALKRLCRTLWVNSIEEERLFSYQFDLIIPPPVEVETNSPTEQVPAVDLAATSQAAATAPVAAQLLATPSNTLVGAETSAPMTEPPRSNAAPAAPAVAAPPAAAVLDLGDEVYEARAVALANDDESTGSFFLRTEYLPVTRRQMKQSWRYMRRMVRDGPAVELDLAATIEQIGRQGALTNPVLAPRRVNRAALLLAIDQDGSMVPFHALGRRLAETAARGGHLRSADIYFFQNCPIDYFYRDPARLEGETIEDTLKQLSDNQTGILIFSDAGAARGGRNPKRIAATAIFLEQLRRQVRHIAWLNPMPRSRWRGTSADSIAQIVAMFECNRRGLYNAISVLRGRVVYQGRHF